MLAYIAALGRKKVGWGGGVGRRGGEKREGCFSVATNCADFFRIVQKKKSNYAFQEEKLTNKNT